MEPKKKRSSKNAELRRGQPSYLEKLFAAATDPEHPEAARSVCREQYLASCKNYGITPKEFDPYDS